MVDGTYCSETLNDMPDTAKASTINIDVGATVIVRKGKLEGQKGKVVDKANGWYKVQTFAEDITTSFRASDLGMISSPPSKGSDSCPSPAGSVASSTASAKSASPLLQNASPVMTSSSHRHTSSPSSKRDSKAPRCHEALSGRTVKTRGSTSMLSSTSEASPARGASGTDAGVEMGERERGGDKGTDAGTNEVSDEAATGIKDTRVGEGKDASERQAQERENECLEECQDKEHQQQKDEEEKGQGVLIVRETLDKGNKELMEENAEEENSGERDDVEGEDYTDGEEIQENDQGEGPHDMLERERTERNKRGDGGEALEGVAQCELGQDEGRDDGEDGALERGTSKRTGEGGAGGDFGEKRVEGEAMAMEEQDGKDEEEDEQEEGDVNAEEGNSGERDDVEGEDYTDGEEKQENDQGEGTHDMFERERTERNKRGDGGEALEGVAQCELGQDEGRDDGEDGALERGTSKRTGEEGAGGDFEEKRVEGEAMAVEEQDGKDEEDEQEEGDVNAEEGNSGERDDVEGEDYTDGEEKQENDQGEGTHDMFERERTERNKGGDGGEALEGVAQCELGQDEGRDDGEDGALERGTSTRTGEGGAGGDFEEKRVEGEAMAIEEQDGKDEEEDEQEEGGVADRKEGEEMTGQEEAQDEPEDDEMTEEEDVDDGHQEDDEMTEQDEEASSEDEDEQEEEEEDEDEDEVDLEAMIKLAASAARGHASSTPASASGGGSAVRKQPSGEGGPARARKRPCGAIRSLDSGLSNPKGLLDTGSRKGETLSASAHGKVAKLYARSALYTGQGRAMSLEKTKTPKDETAGKGWFHMEQAEMTPELKRDLDVIRMRNFVDPKRFYKSSDKASKFMQVGTVKESAAEFFSSRLTKKERKKTLVDELLVADETFRAYAKNQYKSIQTKKKAGGKAQYKDLMRKRKGGLKWKP